MEKLDKYIDSIITPEDELLRELDRETNLKVLRPRMISGHLQGNFLRMLAQMVNPRTVLEIGTFTGYSALCLAAGVGEQGEVHTIEIDDELESLAGSFFRRSPHGHKIRQHIGSALEIAPQLGQVFDLVFMDGNKREYPDYWRMVMGDSGNRPLVRSGSVIIADNVLWYGKVAEPVDAKDAQTKAIVEFNRMVCEDRRVENVVVPMRDGLNLIRVK